MKKALFALLFSAFFAGCNCNKDAAQTASEPEGSVTTVSVDDFAKIIEQKEVRLIDVRTAKEFAEGHIANAENKDVNSSSFGTDIVPQKGKKKSNVLAVYCRSGKRSLKAAGILAPKGFTVYNLDGGILAWQRAGKAVEK